MADDTKLYTLTVPNYSTKLLSELNCLRAKNLCCDVKICTDEGFLYAHKIVMCSVSPYFKERISLSSHEPDTIDVNNTNHHLLNCILNFVYTGTLQFNIIHLESIVQLLNKLEIKDLLAILGELKNSCKNGNDSTTDFDLNETPVIEWPKVNEVDQEPVAGEEDNSIMSKRKLYDDDTDIEQYEDNLGHVTNVDSPRESSVDMPTETLATIIQDKTDKKKSRKSLDKKRKLTTTQPRKKVPPVKISLKKMMDATIADDGVKVDIDSIPLDSSFSESQGDAEFETVGGYIVKVEPNDSTDDAPDYSKEPPTKKNIKPEMQSKSKQCKFCDEVFSNYKDYLVHRKTHVKGPDDVKKKRIRKKPYLCSVCSRAMSSAVRRACHEYSKHGIPYDSSFKLYTCTFEGCNYISANKRYVDNHMRGPHSDERPHICEYCGKAFKMPGALWTHTNIHTKQKEYKCEDCGMNFHQQSGLDIHKKKHHMGEDSWSELCHLCSEKFLHKGELCWHLFIVHKQPIPDRYKVYTCELCDYKTIRREQFERHQNSHTDERKWPCTICGKKFLSKTYLTRHMQFHGEKKNVCDYPGCGFATADKFGLKSHIKRMHTAKNLKPYACTLCTYKTGVRGNLGKHIRTVHKLEVVTKHTVHHKVKFKDRESGDIITKDGELVQSAKERLETSRLMKMEAGNCDFPY